MLAESLGFRATIERQLPGTLECTDLLLEREGFTIAVEITVTNTLDYELRNIGKCLRAGVTQVAVVALDAEKIAKLETAAFVSYGDQHRQRLLFFTKDAFIEYLQTLVLTSPPPEPESPKPTKHKGWTVKTVSVQITPEEAKEREAAAAKILANASRKKPPPEQT